MDLSRCSRINTMHKTKGTSVLAWPLPFTSLARDVLQYVKCCPKKSKQAFRLGHLYCLNKTW